MNNQNKLAVIGDKDSIILFKTLPVATLKASALQVTVTDESESSLCKNELFGTESVEEIEKTIRRLAKEEVPIIFITEETAQKVPELIDFYKFKRQNGTFRIIRK